MFRCMAMSQCDSLKCTRSALCTTDVHKIVSISPHNLAYAILIWPPCTHRTLHHQNCLRKLARAISLLRSIIYLFPSSIELKNLQSTSSNSSPLFIVRSKIHPDFCFSHKVYHSHCQFLCVFAILRTKCTNKNIWRLRNFPFAKWIRISLSVLILLSFCNNFLFLPLCYCVK